MGLTRINIPAEEKPRKEQKPQKPKQEENLLEEFAGSVHVMDVDECGQW